MSADAPITQEAVSLKRKITIPVKIPAMAERMKHGSDVVVKVIAVLLYHIFRLYATDGGI